MNEKPESHQALADELHMDTRDPYTRLFVAALYWRAVADYYRSKAQEQSA